MEITIIKDKQDLERLEGIIEKGMQTFYEVGKALTEIKTRGIARYEQEIELWEKLIGGTHE